MAGVYVNILSFAADVSIVEALPEVDFLDEAQEYWEEHFDDVVKDIKEYANSKVKKPIEDRESSNFFINTNGEN